MLGKKHPTHAQPEKLCITDSTIWTCFPQWGHKVNHRAATTLQLDSNIKLKSIRDHRMEASSEVMCLSFGLVMSLAAITGNERESHDR